MLINPTRYLGNLLIAGGLIQQFAKHCAERQIEFTLVVDAAFAELLEGALPATRVLLYPRNAIKQARGIGNLREYWRFLQTLRATRADIAFNIEEDSVSHRLTQLSGAQYRLGCSSKKSSFGFEQVIATDFSQATASGRHRWHYFQQVFAALDLPATPPHYLQLPKPVSTRHYFEKLKASGIDLQQHQIVLHAGATKAYKKWPLHYFAQLCEALRMPGRQIVFIGAGKDAEEIAEVLQHLAQPLSGIVNLCNRLSLAELAAYLTHVKVIVGNDSGPFHLASAQGVPGLVIFGPTDAALWSPLAPQSQVLKGKEPCAPQCSRQHCVQQHRCLTSLTPALVLEQLQPLLH